MGTAVRMRWSWLASRSAVSVVHVCMAAPFLANSTLPSGGMTLRR